MTNETLTMAIFYANKLPGVKTSLFEHYTVTRGRSFDTFQASHEQDYYTISYMGVLN